MKKNFDEQMKKNYYENSDTDNKLIFNFLNISHTMHFLYEGKGSQKRILIILLENDSITQQELTERLDIKPGSASEVIAKLENNDFITRTQSTKDRRTADIKLTEKGRALAEEAKAQREARHNEMFSSLSENEKATLLTLLEKINFEWKKAYTFEGGHHHHHHHHHKHHHEHHHDHSSPHEHHGDGKKRCDGNCSECPHPCGKGRKQI